MFEIDADFPTNFANFVIQKDDARNIARQMRDVIRNRTQAGLGFEGNSLTRLPLLRERTIENRRRYSGKKGKNFSPAFSNLTQSGDLLRSLSARKRQRVQGRLTVSNTKATSRRRRLTNNQLVDVLRKKGFDFLGITNVEEEALRDDYQNLVNRRLNELSD